MADDTATETHIDELQAQLVALQTAKGCLDNKISRLAEEIKKALDQLEYYGRKPTISNSEYFLYRLTEEKKLEHTYDQKTRFAMENPP